MKVHAGANLFPMMGDEELQALADDIKANGQQRPIAVDNDGQLIDGRNWLAACKLAGVKPLFETITGDPTVYITSANLNRRNITKGQAAMITAMLHPEGEQGRGKNAEARKAQLSGGFSVERLRQARTVLRYSQPLAEAVALGKTSLNDAFQSVHASASMSRTQQEQLDNLRKHDPDLAELVDEERMTLADALAAFAERNIQRQRIREGGRTVAEELRHFPDRLLAIKHAIAEGEKIVIKQSVADAFTEAAKEIQKLARMEK